MSEPGHTLVVARREAERDRSERATRETEPPDALDGRGYLRELELMAQAARAKRLPSALVLEAVRDTWAAESATASLEEQRETFDLVLEWCRSIDEDGPVSEAFADRLDAALPCEGES